MIKKFIFVICIILIILVLAFIFLYSIDFELSNIGEERLEVETIVSNTDYNENGIPDSVDFVNGARKEAVNKTRYIDKYYSGGYPPEDEGVCTDVIWRALYEAGYSLKDLVDEDIKRHTKDYRRVNGSPEPNIDFRRVPNLVAYLDKVASQLTLEVIPWDAENLKEWQGGDIVVFSEGFNHIGIVSDKRNKNGVPLLIHNSWGFAREENALLYSGEIVRHYRFSV